MDRGTQTQTKTGTDASRQRNTRKEMKRDIHNKTRGRERKRQK